MLPPKNIRSVQPATGQYHKVASAKAADAINDPDVDIFHVPLGFEVRVPARSRVTAFARKPNGESHMIGMHFDVDARIVGPAVFSLHEKSYQTRRQRNYIGLPNRHVTAAALIAPGIALMMLSRTTGSLLALTAGSILTFLGAMSSLTGIDPSSGLALTYTPPDLSGLDIKETGSPILGFSQ